jgi:hypothetical protein
MLQVRYPLNMAESDRDKQSYIRLCLLDLATFKIILRQYMNIPRLIALQGTFDKSKVLKTTFLRTNTKHTVLIADQFINELRCRFDEQSGYCYYYIPRTIRCIGTNISLLYIIKLIEYGNDVIPPFGWISHSYLKFKDYLKERSMT